MNLRQLASKIAKLEGKKSVVKIGDVREIIGILGDILHAELTIGDYELLASMLQDGYRRSKKKKPSKPKKK